VEALINSEYPSISLNSLGDSGWIYSSPLCYLVGLFRVGGGNFFDDYQVSEKFHFLLKRGADVNFRDWAGATCLHLILVKSHSDPNEYNEPYFVSVLMAMITAGADINAVEDCGLTISDYVCLFNHEEIWIQVLAECGYDPWEVFTLENKYLRQYPGIDVFSAAKVTTRLRKLSFEEYFSHRDSIKDVETLRHDDDWEAKTDGEIKAIYGEDKDSSDECDECDEYGDIDSFEWNDGSTEDDGYCCPTDMYKSINGDPTWLAYVPGRQFLWYWEKTDCSTSTDSEHWDGSNEDEDEE
jgi:hypothetical protein